MPNIPEQDNSEKEPSRLLQEAGMYVFMGEITDDAIRPIIEWILVENHVVRKKKKELLLMICSEGGAMESAFALIDVMRNSSHNIRTVGIGSVISSAFLIFAAGDSGERYIGKNASCMMHQYSNEFSGKYHDITAAKKETELNHTRMIALLSQFTSLDAETVKSTFLSPTDNWLTPEEMLNYGVADYIF